MVLLFVAVAIGLYMAWNIGANDVANAMGTSVGSRALTFKRAVIVAGIFEFAGAVLVGGHVTNTVRKGIIDPAAFTAEPNLLLYGMLAALIAAALWLNLASFFGQPVSTTHSIVGAIFGFGLVAGGAVNWAKMSAIVASWVISPLVSGILGFVTFVFIKKKILAAERPDEAAARYAPFFVMVVGFILSMALIFKGLKNLHLDWPMSTALLASAAVAVVFGVLAKLLLPRPVPRTEELPPTEEFDYTERIFKYLQITTASYVAFAHGANDVANAVGPLAAIYAVQSTGEVSMKVDVPVWILLVGAAGIVLGLGMFGRRVMETVGNKITHMTPTRGFSAEFAAATTVLVCSKIGLPISTTHSLVGAVMGVGLARGLAALQMRTVRSIFTSWVATVPATAAMTILLYWLASWLLV
ncbi:MAG: inorganic phosphate transporter [Candidatus Krumholzibacteriia bacterium]